jgi:hypothetical protein
MVKLGLDTRENASAHDLSLLKGFVQAHLPARCRSMALCLMPVNVAATMAVMASVLDVARRPYLHLLMEVWPRL